MTADRQIAGGNDAVPQAKLAKLKEEVARLNAINKDLQRSEDEQISLTDPDARSMATSGKDTGIVGCNVQAAVDTKHHLIVAHGGRQRRKRSPPARQHGRAGARRVGQREARCGRRPRLL